MLDSLSVIRAAELRRLDFLTQAECERQIDVALATRRAASPVAAQPATPSITLAAARRRSPRYCSTSGLRQSLT